MPDGGRETREPTLPVIATGAVLAVVRDISSSTEPDRYVRLAEIHRSAGERFDLSPSRVNASLRELVETGLLERPWRGRYIPKERR